MDRIRVVRRLAIFLLACWQTESVQGQTEKAFRSLPLAEVYKTPDPTALGAHDVGALQSAQKHLRQVQRLRRETQQRVRVMLKGRSASATAEMMDQWFEGFVFPSMTQTDDDSLARLGEMRQAFFHLYFNDTPPSPLRDRVLQRTVATMQEIVHGDFHPACRTNALLVLGRLNQREGDRSAARLPLPLPEMSDYLLRLIGTDEIPDYLKVAVLTGLDRHASLRQRDSTSPFSSDQRAAIAWRMADVLQMKPSGDRPREWVDWMQRRAIRVIGLLQDTGDQEKYADRLREVIGDASRKAGTRVAAVQALGMLDFTQRASAARPAITAELIGKFISDAARQEAEFIEHRIFEIRLTAKFLDGDDPADPTNLRGNIQTPGVDRGQQAEAPGAGGDVATEPQPAVEILPGHERNSVRRRIKSIAWSGRTALAGNDRQNPDGGFIRFASATEVELMRALVEDIDHLMAMVDLPDIGGDESATRGQESLANRLKVALEAGSESILETLTGFNQEDASPR